MDWDRSFAEAVQKGLSSKPKRIPSTYFYDDRGSKIFQQIMELPEYYLTRSETDIFKNYASEIIDLFRQHFKEPFDIVELGAGDATKTQLLLTQLLEEELQCTYRPTDIDGHILRELQKRLKEKLPTLNVHPVIGLHEASLEEVSASKRPKVIVFLGSNIGNYTQADSLAFIRQIGAAMNSGDLLLLGCDRKKDPKIILPAYNDAQGVTERFNKNLLVRINRELGGNFDPDLFQFYPQYSPETGELRSYLMAKEVLTVSIDALQQEFTFKAWEYIHTEISRKHDEQDLSAFAEAGNLKKSALWTDKNRYFWEVLYEKRG